MCERCVEGMHARHGPRHGPAFACLMLREAQEEDQVLRAERVRPGPGNPSPPETPLYRLPSEPKAQLRKKQVPEGHAPDHREELAAHLDIAASRAQKRRNNHNNTCK